MRGARRAAQDRGAPQGAARSRQARAGAGAPGAGGGPALAGGWFHETLVQASASETLTSLLTLLRHKIAWMYVVESPARPQESWAEHGAIVDAVARGDAE
ncbi:FCD domain-containing protein, partial [Streptomyces sp. SA3_actF]|uniref:FCD domain-containing protein n=1 Tax=Streptomyces sp. SA3_actF TaxID=682181 RepID=UPI003B636EC2